MRILKGLVIETVLLCVFWVMPAHATVDWNESFEYANDAAFGVVWDHSCLGNPGISTTRAHSGTKSAKLHYTGQVGVDPGAGGCFMDRPLLGKSDTLYTRFWVYLDNFVVNGTGTKVTLQGPFFPGRYPSFWWELFNGAAVMSVEVQGIILDNGSLDSQRVFGGSTVPQNQWACVELRATMSTPGMDNGILQVWTNGTQTMNKTNQRMRAATLNQLNSPTAQFDGVRLYTQHGVGDIYYDEYAVSRDARIGCTGSPAGDIQAPLPPSNLR
ncbi:MAG: hypothetical protein ABI988_07450 [Nitrospirota bacterium]